jgi:hypothetical protein
MGRNVAQQLIEAHLVSGQMHPGADRGAQDGARDDYHDPTAGIGGAPPAA